MAELDTAVADRRRRRRRRGLVVLLLTLAIASLGAGAFSLALFTDTDAESGSFTAGTIDINTTTPVTPMFTVTDLMPGDSGSSTLTVRNDGSAQLRYAMDSASTNADALDLRSVLNMTITAGACPGAGLPLSSGPLWTSALVHSKFGDQSAGDDSGDRVLDAGTTEDLCFAWDLPDTTGDAFQGSTTTATFTFYAEQTANNP
jgi:predicted ribosomally synthesized peptide with SipW-like signal peptide